MDSFELKPLTPAGIDKALDKANRYRLLNEPGVSESICRDVIAAAAANVEARKVLLLALTDMFGRGLAGRYEEALRLSRSLPDDYSRTYYEGIVYERRAKAHHRSLTPGCGGLAYTWLRRAMDRFAAAIELRPAGEDEAVLRWNNCVRRLQSHPELQPDDAAEDIVPQLGE